MLKPRSAVQPDFQMMDDGGGLDMAFEDFGHQSEGKQPSLLGQKRVSTLKKLVIVDNC